MVVDLIWDHIANALLFDVDLMIPLIALKMLSSSSVFDKSPDIRRSWISWWEAGLWRCLQWDFLALTDVGGAPNSRLCITKIEEADVVVYSEDQARACVINLCICSRCPICCVSVTRPVSLLANRMICYSVITGYFGFFISKGQLPGLVKPALCFSSEEIGKFFRQYICNVVGYAVHGFTAKGLIRLQIETLEGHRWIATYNS